MVKFKNLSIDLLGCENGTAPIDTQFSDHTCGDLHFNLSPYENNRIRLTGFADFLGTTEPTEAERKNHTSILINHDAVF